MQLKNDNKKRKRQTLTRKRHIFSATTTYDTPHRQKKIKLKRQNEVKGYPYPQPAWSPPLWLDRRLRALTLKIEKYGDLWV